MFHVKLKRGSFFKRNHLSSAWWTIQQQSSGPLEGNEKKKTRDIDKLTVTKNKSH